jgi:hypothetical protein
MLPLKHYVHWNLLCLLYLPVGIHHVQDGLEFWVHLSFLHYREIVSQSSQTRLELLVIQLARLVLVKVPVIGLSHVKLIKN